MSAEDVDDKGIEENHERLKALVHTEAAVPLAFNIDPVGSKI